MKVKIGKYRKNRKIEVVIDSYDIWNLDHTLSLIIHPCLLKLRESKHGSPRVDNDDVPEELRSEIDPVTWDEPTVHEKWSWVLDEMIWSFDQIANNDRCGIGTDQVAEERIDNGMRLFGKYFRGLWT